MAQKITIDGVEYDLDSLSENARAQVVNLRASDGAHDVRECAQSRVARCGGCQVQGRSKEVTAVLVKTAA